MSATLGQTSATLCQIEAQLVKLTTQVDLVARDVKDILAHLKGRVHGASQAD